MALLRRTLVVVCVVWAAIARAGQVVEGDPLPPLELADRDGARVELRGDAAAVVIVEFWASWCAPCRAMLPAVAALTAEHPDRVRLYAVNIDRDPEKAADFLAEHLPVVPENVTVLQDPESIVLARFGARGMPAVFVAENGVVRLTVAGAQADFEERLRRLVVGMGAAR